MGALSPEQIQTVRALHAKYRLPGNATCQDCLNYLSQCREMLAGSLPLRPETDTCYWGEPKNYFNVLFGLTLGADKLEAIRKYKGKR